MPAEAGIQVFEPFLDSRFRGNDISQSLLAINGNAKLFRSLQAGPFVNLYQLNRTG